MGCGGVDRVEKEAYGGYAAAFADFRAASPACWMAIAQRLMFKAMNLNFTVRSTAGRPRTLRRPPP